MSSTLFGVSTPSLTDATDGAPYTLGTRFTPAVDGSATHGRWWFPTTAVSGVRVGIFRVSDQVLLGSASFSSPVAGDWNQVAFTPAISLTAGVAYLVAIYTPSRYVASAGYIWPFTSGDLTAAANNGWFNDSGAQLDLTWPPTEPGNDAAYFADLIFEPSGLTPVTSTLTAQWRVSNRVTSTLDMRWRVFNRVTSTLDTRWRIYSRVSSTMTAQWRVFSRVVSALESRWRVANRVISTLTVRWRVTPDGAAPVAGNAAVLAAQRQATLAYIAYDPTTIELVPSVRVTTPSGGFTEVDGAPRDAQSVKLIELAYDQRPTLTQNGIERVIDYHLMGRWDMQIAVGDYWIDDQDCRWDIVGFSEGWDYMTKAYAARHIPRESRP